MAVASPDRDRLLHARGISKAYGAVLALDDVDFSVSRGAVHGVLGKNGAGKSTLMALIAGLTDPTRGRIFLEGVDITDRSLAERNALGIHLMEQHTEVFESLTVAENLALPDYPRRRGLVDWHEMRESARRRLERYGLDVDVDQLAGTLTLPDQRKLSLINTLAENGKLVILDEPTTAMTLEERGELFRWIRELTAAGLTFIYITHFNHDLREVCDEYTVLRDGRVAGAGGSVGELTGDELSSLVTGSHVVEFRRRRRPATEALLEVDGLVVEGTEPTSFELGAGEIVGLVGLPGSGAREVARALGGLERTRRGTVRVGQRPVKLRHPTDALDAGIAYLTHDRIGEGLIPQITIRENLRVGNWPTRRLPGYLDLARMRRGFDEARQAFSISASGPDQLVNELSGGNQQKVLLARLVGTDPKVLILDEPTAGIDVGSKEEVHRLVDQLTADGIGVLILAYDPGELVRLVDRALVFRDGVLVSQLVADQLTSESVLTDLSHSPTTHTGAL